MAEGVYEVKCKDCGYENEWITPKNKCTECGSPNIKSRYLSFGDYPDESRVEEEE